MEEVIEFFKSLFGDDFVLNGVSHTEGEILSNDQDILEKFFIGQLNKNTIWYDPIEGILYSYHPVEDSFFKKAVTNAWAFKYIFYPVFMDGWGGWYNEYKFQVYEKGIRGNYKYQKTI